jgi:hypothetical protein
MGLVAEAEQRVAQPRPNRRRVWHPPRQRSVGLPCRQRGVALVAVLLARLLDAKSDTVLVVSDSPKRGRTHARRQAGRQT